MTASGDSESRLLEWLALRRAHDGGVVLADDRYVQHGRVVVGHVADMITLLIDGGYLALGTPDPRGHRVVCVTVTGQARYLELQHGDGRGRSVTRTLDLVAARPSGGGVTTEDGYTRWGCARLRSARSGDMPNSCALTGYPPM